MSVDRLLTSLIVPGAKIGWWARRKVERTLRRRRASRPDPVFHPANVR